MTRIQKFHGLKSHPWYQRLYKKLSLEDIAFCIIWIIKNDHLKYNEFEKAVNRMFLDQINKPKQFPIIMELIATANIKEN